MSEIPKLAQQVFLVLVSIPIILVLLYVVTRVVTTACLNSWWSTKIMYSKKLLDTFKENVEITKKEEEGKNGHSRP